jgi:hypothetical protein
MAQDDFGELLGASDLSQDVRSDRGVPLDPVRIPAIVNAEIAAS